MSCPGSILAIRSLPAAERDRTSAYADEGTAAHTLAEACLRRGRPARDALGKMIRGKLQRWEVTEEMVDAVQIYLDEVNYHVERLGGELLIERTVRPLPDRDDMYGTGDAIVIETFGELIVIDLKYGKGVIVETDWNDQAMYYGLGSLEEIGRDDVSSVTIVIVQPRAPHPDGPVRRWTIPVEILTEFAEQLRAAADATAAPDAPLKAGEHCRFCPAAALCPALRERAFAVAADDFEELPDEIGPAHVRLPDVNDPEALGRAARLVPILDFFCREVEGMVQRTLERGKYVPGKKLVRKRANRVWRDPADVERMLRNRRGVRVDDIFKKTLLGPAPLERIKSIGKKFVAANCHKPEGGLTVTDDSDPRDAVVAPMIADFAGTDFPEGFD